MDRRGFLGSIFAACAAPAIVRADSLMRIVPTDALILPAYDIALDVGPTYGNCLLTIDQITREALRVVYEKAAFVSSINRQYDGTFKIRAPNRYTTRRVPAE